jgi:DNA-binding PadR family transcriptional regulator
MTPGTQQDPVRATLVAILQQLNQVVEVNAHNVKEQSLELDEIEQRLSDFWAVTKGTVKVPLALGLLLRNGLVQAQNDATYSWQRQRGVAARYQITTEGKRFLVQVLEKSDRIP